MYCLEFTEQALVCQDQLLVEVIVAGNQVKALTDGRTTEGVVTLQITQMLVISTDQETDSLLPLIQIACNKKLHGSCLNTAHISDPNVSSKNLNNSS